MKRRTFFATTAAAAAAAKSIAGFDLMKAGRLPNLTARRLFDFDAISNGTQPDVISVDASPNPLPLPIDHL